MIRAAMAMVRTSKLIAACANEARRRNSSASSQRSAKFPQSPAFSMLLTYVLASPTPSDCSDFCFRFWQALIRNSSKSLDDADLKSQALAVSHAENVLDWVRALSGQTGAPQRLVDVQAQLKMPMVEVWIAALLGGFLLEQRGEFYETQEVWVAAGR